MAKLPDKGGIFSLPIIKSAATPQQALDALIESKTSAVVVRSGAALRILDETLLVDALVARTKHLDLVIETGLVAVQPAKSPQARPHGFIGLFEIEEGRFTASHEYLVSRYLTPPRVTRCTHEPDHHYYPPETRSLVDRDHCVVCGELIITVG